MNNQTTCNLSSLDAYIPSSDNPWTEEKVRHLYRRIGFGADYEMIQEALSKAPSDLIDDIIEETINEPLIKDPGWGYWDKPTFEALYEDQFDIRVSFEWDTMRYLESMYYDIMREKNLTAGLINFWSNHFVTESVLLGKTPQIFQQLLMRQKYCIGNFKDFVYQVGIDTMMLHYLNGLENKAGKPNENYARELYELFTLGVDNGYNQQDIVETAKALTGFNTLTIAWGDITFDESTFDDSEKTIFGQTGNWGYDDVIRILFEEKSTLIANYICEEFYKHFVSPDANQEIINQLAQIFLDNDFEIAPVMRVLFKSEHFFDDQSFGTIIKSPVDLISSLQKELNMELSGNPGEPRSTILFEILKALDVRVYSPPNVAGWPGDETWINSITLPERWVQTEKLLSRHKGMDPQTLFDFVTKRFDITATADEVARYIVNFFLSKELVYEEEYLEAIAVFKSGFPENYFVEGGIWNINFDELDEQVYNLLLHISRMPEFQLK